MVDRRDAVTLAKTALATLKSSLIMLRSFTPVLIRYSPSVKAFGSGYVGNTERLGGKVELSRQ